MDRLTTDTPETNLQTALNLFYVKDGQAWVRGGGPEPDYKDCSLYDYIRKTMVGVLDPVERGNIEMLTDVEIGSIMADWLMDGHCCIPGLIAHLYTAAWAFAEIREKLKRYEDAEEEGRLIVLPCPIGTPVYVHRHLCHGLPRGRFNGDCWLIQDCPRNGLECPEEVREEAFTIAMREGLGKWFWLTREEAEAALPRERRNRK